MKKLTTLVLLAFFVLTGMSAQTTAKEQAQTLAERFFKQGQRVQSGAKGVRSAKATSLECRWDSRDVLSASSAAPTFYAFEPEVGQGFVIVAGDGDNARVIGYSYENSLPEASEMPDGMRDFLTEYSVASAKAVQSRANYDYDATTMGNIIVNLNTAPWGQRTPFNKFCYVKDGAPGSAITGCVPTAYSILMYYHKWPLAAKPVTVYHSGTGESRTLGHEYDWANMLHSYSGTYTTAQADAVATLMHDMGWAYQVKYEANNTSTDFGYGEGAAKFIEIFKYKSNTPASDSETKATTRHQVDDATWKQYIKQSLDAGLPIPYSSTTSATGTGRHIYILDGYTDKDYFHFNWGWNGSGNGWFLLSDMTPDASSNYSNSHKAYFMLSPDKGEPCTITVSTDCGTCGTVLASYGSTTGESITVDQGASVTLTAMPADGYLFEKWTCGTEDVSTSATCKVSAEGDAEYVAHFKEIATIFYTVDVSSAEATFGLVKIEGDAATASANKTVNHGTTMTLTAEAKDGYLFKNWTRDDEVVSIDNPWVVTVEENVSYKANFVPKQQGANITITTTTEGSGSVTINGESTNTLAAKVNEEFTLAATPASGYYFVEWRVDDKVVSTKATFTTSAQTARTYKAVFAEKTGDVTIRVYKSSGGSAIVGGTTKVTVVKGEVVTITATPTEGKKFAYWSVGSSEGGEIVTNANPYSFVALSGKSYYANFVDTSADLSVSATTTAGVGGTASVTGDMTKGGEVTFKAKANDGYCFSHWENSNAEKVSTEPYYSTVVASDLTLKAVFEVSGSAPEVYNISVAVNGTNGTATASSNSVTEGDQVTLTAKPNAGYQFVNWTLNGNVVSTDATYTFTPTASGEYVANFEKVTLPEVTGDFIKGDGVLRFYRLALPVTLSSYQSDFESSATKVYAFWQEAETFLNKLYIPLGICFEVVEDPRLIASSSNYIDTNSLSATSYGTELTNGLIGEGSYDVGLWISLPVGANSGSSTLSGAYSKGAKGSGYAMADVTVVGHELGHLFGAHHTDEQSPNLTEPAAGGSSLMSTSGLTRDFFSVASLRAIRSEMVSKNHSFYADAARTQLVGSDGGYNYVYGVVPGTSSAPMISATGMKTSYSIPKGACFAMPIPATDANGDRLTYTFQQYEDGAVFHAYAPQESNVVTFYPEYTIDPFDDTFMEVAGSNIPSMAAGTYNFAAVVNDLPAASNMTLAAMQSNPFYSNYDAFQTQVTIVDGTPFTVSLSPNQASYAAGDPVTVKWGVDYSYFGTQLVRILLSDDYGKTFKHTLAENVPATNGSCTVTMPDLNMTTKSKQFKTALPGVYKEVNVRPGIIRVEVVGDIAYSLSWTDPASSTAEGGFLVTGGSGEVGGDEGEQTEDITAETAELNELIAEMKDYIDNFATVTPNVVGGVVDYKVTFTADHGAVTADMVAEAYRAMDAAEATLATATTKAELNTSIAALQTKLTALQTNKALPGEGGESEDLTADKAALQALIDKAEALIANCGKVVYKPATEDTKLALQVKESTGEYYLSTNANQNVVGTKNDGDGIGALLDGKTSSYMHTQWDGTPVDDDHYVQVTLNSAKQLGAFTFTYATRAGASITETSPAPTIIKVYTSADGSTFTDSGISFSSDASENPLPKYSDLGAYWTSSQIELNNPKAIRFYVTGSAGPGNNNYGGHYFFAMSEFGLTALGTPESYEATVNPGTEVTSELLLATYEEVTEARAALSSATTVAELTAAKEALDARYNELLEASKNSTTPPAVDDLAAAQEALQTLIEQTNSLLETSATVTASEKEQATKLALQTTDDQADAHLYCNAPHSDKNSTDYSPASEGYWLLDGDNTTFLHTNWDNNINSADGLDHYIRVYSAEALDKFTFTYTTRWKEDGGIWIGNPTVIEVEGCNTPNGTYESIATLSNNKGTNPLPTQKDLGYAQVYTSDLIAPTAPYKYIRFRVTATEQNNTAYGHKWFYISEFAFSKVETVKVYEAVLHGSNGVTETIAIDTYKAIEEATAALSATTADELTAAKAALQAQYEVLLAASNSNVDKAALRTIIDKTQALVDACYDVKGDNKVFKYGGSLYITEADAQEAAAAVETAEATYNSATLTQTQCDAEATRMQGVYDKLAYAVSHANLPVRVTTDLAKPYIYTIGINRSATSLLEWDANTSMVAVAGKYEFGNEAQAWCFFDATEGRVYIAPYQEFSSSSYRVLSSKDLSEGNSKVIDVVKGTDGYTQEWTIVYNADKNMYNIYCLNDKGDKFYFSNHTSVNHKMGFYNDVNDPGSLFRFSALDAKTLSYSDAYNKLYNFVEYDVKVHGSIIGHDTNVGFYTEAMASAYNDAYSAANSALKDGADEVDDATYEARYDALFAANSALHINLPMDGKVYRFRSAANHDYCNGAFVYADVNDNKLRWKKSDATAEAATLWSFTAVGTSGYTLQNLHTGTYMQNFVANNPSPLTESNSATASIVSLSGNGQVGIKINGTMMHAQQAYTAVVHWNTEAGGASAWLVEEVDLSEVKFPVSISKYGYAGLHLNYPVNIPDSVEAYVVKKATGEEGVAILEKIDGIIPANTGVILKSQAAYDAQAAKEYVLTHAASDGVEPEVSLLEGANYKQYVKAEADTDYYLFGAKSGVVGLYKAYEEYNIGGTTGFTEITEPGGTLNGVYPIPGNTYYLCNKQTSGEDVVFSVANGAIAFNKEKKIDDSYRWLCSKNDDGTYVFKNVATNQYFAWRGLSNNAYKWNLFDTVQENFGDDLQAGCVSMKNGKYLVVKNGIDWDESTKDGYYRTQFSSSFYFEKYEAKSTSKTNDGGYFQCSANKIYLPYSAVDNASKFTFRFDGGTTTDLEEALFGNDAKEEIFDLQGRRVERITASGLYIVNGQKRYVKAAKF